MNWDTKDFELLSAYLDGELSQEERKQLEQKISSSLELQKKLDDLQRIKQFTSSSYNRIPESPYFETRLFANLESYKPWYKRVLKWSPAIGLALTTVIIMVVLKFNPGIITNLIEQQKSNIAGFYKENLQPLLFTADINNEDIFNFAMYKQLPLDKENKQFLHLGYDTTGREYFEIKNVDVNQSKNNLEKFLVALDITEIQRQKIDSIINQYAEELEAQILVNKNNTVAINSNLWNYQRAIQTDLLTLAESFNENKFHKFIPRTVSLSRDPQVKMAVLDSRTKKNKNYIFLTPDSIFSESIEFDPKQFKFNLKEKEAELSKQTDELSKQSEKLKEISVKIRYDSSWKKLKDGHGMHKGFQISFDSNLCRVDISKFVMTDMQIPDFDSLFSTFDSVANNFRFYSQYIPRIEYFDDKVKFHFDSDSLKTYEFKYYDFEMDSSMETQNDLLDSLRNYNWNILDHLNDSLVFNGIPRLDHYFKYYDNDVDIELEMKELQEELKKFREEMKDWKKEFRREFRSEDESNNKLK
jgi:hypothetical protein